MKRIYKLASQLKGLYQTLYRDTMPFHNENTDKYQDKAWKIMEGIEEEVNNEIEKENN